LISHSQIQNSPLMICFNTSFYWQTTNSF